MRDLAFRSATALLDALEKKETSSEELLRHFLSRIERLSGTVNAVVTLDADRALEEARRCDEERSRGDLRGALHGLPVTVKDSFETAGLKTTSGGAPGLEAYVPERDAKAVARLKAAGAIVFGKTNLSTLAMDIQTYNAAFGTTNNPWDPSRTAGGSSGGSAVAMSAGLSALELGSDLGGSIRIPAAFCGVFGHRPSYGIVPTRGHIPGPPGTLAAPDLETAGPIARSAEDLDLALRVVARADEKDAVGWHLKLPPPRRRGLSDYRLAAWLDDPAAPVDAALRERLEAVVGELRAAGAEVDTEARPGFALADNARLFMRVMYGSMSSGLPEGQFEKLRSRAAGLAPDDDSLPGPPDARHRPDAPRLRARPGGARAGPRPLDGVLHPLRRPSLPGLPDARLPARPEPRLREADARRERRPGALPRDAPRLARARRALARSREPSAPVGFTRDGLPAGIQVVGPYLEDRTAIHVAKLVAEVSGGYVPPPSVE